MRKVLFVAVALVGGRDDGRPVRRHGRRLRHASDEYIVLYEQGASPAAVKAAVKQAKGRILRANNKVGVATAISANPRFRGDARRSARSRASPATSRSAGRSRSFGRS